MSLTTSIRLARRELRGSFSSFRIFMACLALGVAAIAAIGSVRTAIENSLIDQGQHHVFVFYTLPDNRLCTPQLLADLLLKALGNKSLVHFFSLYGQGGWATAYAKQFSNQAP